MNKKAPDMIYTYHWTNQAVGIDKLDNTYFYFFLKSTSMILSVLNNFPQNCFVLKKRNVG